MRASDEHFEQALHDVVTQMFRDVLTHTQQHVVAGYEAEAVAWDAKLWDEKGRGLPEDFVPPLYASHGRAFPSGSGYHLQKAFGRNMSAAAAGQLPEDVAAARIQAAYRGKRERRRQYAAMRKRQQQNMKADDWNNVAGVKNPNADK